MNRQSHATAVRAEPEGVPTQSQQALHEVATDILGRLDLEDTLLSIVNAVVRLAGADIAGVLLGDAGGERLTMRACTGHRTKGTAHLEVGRGQGVAGKALADGRPVKVDDYHGDPSISRDFAEIAHADGTRSAYGAPLAVRGQVIGVLMGWRRRPIAFSDAEAGAIADLADLAAIAVENARLYEAERDSVGGLEEANRALEERCGLLRRESEVHAELTGLMLDGKGMVDLVATVARQAQGEAAVVDTELAALARSAGAGPLLERAARHLRRAERSSGAHAERTIVVPADEGSERWIVLGAVAADGHRLGYLCVEVAERPGPLVRVLVEEAATVCALELLKEQAVIEARARVRADFLWDLLDGNLDEDAEALVRAHSLGYALPDRMRVVLIRAESARGRGDDGTAPRWRPESLARGAARIATGAAASEAWAACRGSSIALLVPATDDAGEARALAQTVVRRLEAEYPGVRLAAGVSTCVAATSDLSSAHAEAQHALSAAPAVAAEACVAVLDDLGVLRFLLAPGDRDDLAGFARDVLGPVLDYDRDHPSDLIHTVDCYLASDCNLQRAAATLYVHPKTVRYRLDRVEELTEIDLSTQRDRFDAQLAITIVNALAIRDGDE